MRNPTYILRVGSQIQFGKHSGKLVSEVIEIEPKYILWLHENMPSARIKQCTRDAVKLKGILIQ